MLAVLIRDATLLLAEVPSPPLGPQQVRVQVKACGVNRADILQRRGRYPAPPNVPADIPGLEFSGIIIERDPAAQRFPLGTAVMGIVGGGAQAQEVVLHEAELLPVPPSIDLIAAAAIPEAFLTAFDALILQAHLQAQERVLITAVGSGVGTAAIQLTRWRNALAFGTTRTPHKLEQALAIGLLAAFPSPSIDTQDPNFNVILDFLGAIETHLPLLAPHGRLITLGLLQASRGTVDLGRIMRRRLHITGSTLRDRSLADRITLRTAFESDALPAFAAQSLQPILDRILPISAVNDAHTALERNETFGKIVLTW